MAEGLCVGCTVGVGCGMAVGSQGVISLKVPPQVVAQSPQVAQLVMQVEEMHPNEVQISPQVEAQA